MEIETNLLVEAQQLEEQGDFAGAAEKYQQAVELGVDDQALAYQGLGRALARLDRNDEALLACQKALAINKDLPLANGVLGRIYLLQNKLDLAEQQLLTALRLEPDNCKTLTNLAFAYSKSKRYQEATELAEKCIRIQPDCWDYQRMLLGLYIQQANFQKVTKQLFRMVRKRPTMLKLYPLGLAAYLNMIAWAFGKLNILTKAAVIVSFLLVAWLAPLVIKNVIGVLLSIYAVLTLAMSLGSLLFMSQERQTNLIWFVWSISLGLSVLFYWLIVLSTPYWRSGM